MIEHLPKILERKKSHHQSAQISMEKPCLWGTTKYTNGEKDGEMDNGEMAGLKTSKSPVKN